MSPTSRQAPAHTVALKRDGSVWAWGSNGYGAVGDGTETDRSRPVAVGLDGVKAIAAGGDFTLALRTDGRVWAWGANWDGQLGDGTSFSRSSPVNIGLSGVAAIAAGGTHALALMADGTVVAWGRNEFGQLGDGTVATRLAPVVVLREGGGGSIESKDWFLDLDPGTSKTIAPERIPAFLVLASANAGALTANVRFRNQESAPRRASMSSRSRRRMR